jgi:peptidase inhibitor family I36
MVRNMMRTLCAIAALLAASSTASAQRWGHGPTPGAGACFYEDANFRGEYFCVRAGESISSVPRDMNDRISSIRLFGDAEVTVFRDVDFRAGSRRFDTNIRNLVNEGWNDRISSVRVQAPGSGRFDDRFSRDNRRGPDPDVIVRRAYQDILQRDPDPEGLRIYRSHIIDDRWTEEQVRAALRSSAEYRERTTMTRQKAQEIVRRAYLSVLRREPDAAGAEGYINNVLRNRWTQEDVERELRKSPEYRNKK